jgi:hypothetical protein
MSELTLHTGCQGDWDTINIDWFNENGVLKHTKLDIIIQEQDRPRTLEIRVNGVTVAVINSDDRN